jgi:hypothetical protein
MKVIPSITHLIFYYFCYLIISFISISITHHNLTTFGPTFYGGFIYMIIYYQETLIFFHLIILHYFFNKKNNNLNSIETK